MKRKFFANSSLEEDNVHETLRNHTSYGSQNSIYSTGWFKLK